MLVFLLPVCKFVYVCMYVSLYACMYVGLYVGLYVCLYVMTSKISRSLQIPMHR